MANSNVIRIRDKHPQLALAALRRMTGLQWQTLPQSLLDQVTSDYRDDQKIGNQQEFSGASHQVAMGT